MLPVSVNEMSEESDIRMIETVASVRGDDVVESCSTPFTVPLTFCAEAIVPRNSTAAISK